MARPTTKAAAVRKKAAAPNPYFQLRRSRIQGKGAFATQRIPAGTCIIEYTGEIIDDDEADRRYDDTTMTRHHTFLFSIDGGLSIDAAVNGNDARFINHSCEPNCEAIEEAGRVFIHARRAIEPGEELLYDYGYIVNRRITKADREFYACLCGTPSCRGTILAPKKPKPKPKPKPAPAKRATTTPVSRPSSARSSRRGSSAST
jgi:hypothetical protein